MLKLTFKPQSIAKIYVQTLRLISDTGYVDKCDFEGLGGICDYKQVTKDRTDWVPQSGPTQSQETGPGNDHTKGTGTCIQLILN